MDFGEDLLKCQNTLRMGYKEDQTLNQIEWLNDFCSDFLTCCNKIHKFLIFECSGKEEILEKIFLCLNQIVCCTHNIEKIINEEKNHNIFLNPSRQYFLDRMLWCFAKLKSTLNSATDNVQPCEDNFVKQMDYIMSVIEPYTGLNLDVSNRNEFYCEAIVASKKIHSGIDLLLGQILGLGNVVLQKEKIALMASCEKILREDKNLEEECIASKGNYQNIQLKAILLENSLMSLEDEVNEILLKLVFRVFINNSKESVNKIKSLLKENLNNPLVEDEIIEFDLNTDRIMQIGFFASWFAPNVKVRTTIRSCLASLESLDTMLIPSFYLTKSTTSNIHSKLLERHFCSELIRFKSAIHEIIDTNAFVLSYIEQLNEAISDLMKSFDERILNNILDMGGLLEVHLQLIKSELQITTLNDSEEKFKKFSLMLNECRAVKNSSTNISTFRILKRLKIFRSCCNKLVSIFKVPVKNTNEKNEIICTTEKLNDAENFILSCGITPSRTSIFYENKTNHISVFSNHKNHLKVATESIERISINQSFNMKKSLKKRESLRTAMFKRQKNAETDILYQQLQDSSTSLQISEILDQITNLSSTFTDIKNL